MARSTKTQRDGWNKARAEETRAAAGAARRKSSERRLRGSRSNAMSYALCKAAEEGLIPTSAVAAAIARYTFFARQRALFALPPLVLSSGAEVATVSFGDRYSKQGRHVRALVGYALLRALDRREIVLGAAVPGVVRQLVAYEQLGELESESSD